MKEMYKKFKSELLDSCIPFWLNHSVDAENGGIMNCVDFATSHCIDSDGRMYVTVTKDGKPLRKRR